MAYGILVPQQGIGILTIGLPGKSPMVICFLQAGRRVAVAACLLRTHMTGSDTPRVISLLMNSGSTD